MSSNGTISVLIADDEAPARRGLRDLLEPHGDISIVGEARSGEEAIQAIERLDPDVVFLDVEMPDGDGFEVVRAIGADNMPLTIFATAYDSYALRAFEAHALDYLLKPYDRERFESALVRARRELSTAVDARVNEKLRAFLRLVDEKSRHARRVPIRMGERTRFVDVGEVEYFEAEANYVRVHTRRGSSLMRETLTALQARLDPARFARVHRSLIVQVARVAEVESMPSGEYVLVLHGGKRLVGGRTYRSAIQQALGIK